MVDDPADSLVDRCEIEIVEFHEFLEAWLRGGLKRTANNFDRAATAWADEFTLISPSGDVRTRAELLDDVEGAHGTLPSSFRISIEDVQPHCTGDADDLCLLTYEEWQETDGETPARLSSVLFRQRREAPHGVEWIHLHETWLPDTRND